MRLGIMCTGTVFAAWQARCLERLLALPEVEPALLIVDDRPAPRRVSRGRAWLRLLGEGRLAWALFDRLFVSGRSAAMQPVDLGARLAGVPVLRCRVEVRGRYSEHFSAADLAAIRAADLDVVLRFAFGIIRGEVLTLPRYGVWSFHHDDPERYRGTPPGFWEIADGDPLSGAVLQRLTERLDGGVVLQRGWFATIDHSYVENRDRLLFGGADWPARVCADIRHGTAHYLDDPPLTTTAPVRFAPTTGPMLRAGWTLIRNFIRAQAWALFRTERWHVGVVEQPIHAFLDPGPPPTVRWLPRPPGDRFLADPFVLRDGAGTTLVVESYDFRAGRGSLAALTSADGRAFGAPRPVLAGDAHMSYPFLFRHDGETYLVPETAEAREVALYRARRFPTEWERVATLLAGVAALDATLFRHEGRWWLFCTDAERGPQASLHAWYAPDLLGPWQPHAANPLKTDVRSSRPAGTPFVHEGRLYRPAQDSSRGYGSAVVVNRVVRLTPTEFAEEPAARVGPDAQGPWPDGLHTLAAGGDLTFVDGKRHAFSLHGFRHAFAAKARSLGRRVGARLTARASPTRA